MNPKVKERLSGMASDKGIDLSAIMGGGINPIEETMPEISASSVYAMIADQFDALDSDEVLELMHMMLMKRISGE